MSQQATITLPAKLDISPDGIKITFEGMDSDLASLIQSASTFSVQSLDSRSYDTSDIVIKSTKVISFVDPTPTV